MQTGKQGTKIMEKKLSYYTFYYFMSLVLMRGGGILAKILLARSITPYEYGLITLFVIALPGMFQNITTFCFYDVLGHATEGKKYLGFALKYRHTCNCRNYHPVFYFSCTGVHLSQCIA